MDMEHWLSVSKTDDSKGPVLISGITGVECIGGFPGISEETDAVLVDNSTELQLGFRLFFIVFKY